MLPSGPPTMAELLHCREELISYLRDALFVSAESHEVQTLNVPSPSHPGGTMLIAAFYTPTCGNLERNTMVEDIQSEFED